MVDGVEMTLARLEALEQLLQVHESTAADQTGRLEESVRQLRARDVRLRREAEIIETLHRVGRLLSAQLELEPLVQLATDAVVEVTGAQFGAFFYNAAADGDEAYLLYAVSGVDRSHVRPVPDAADRRRSSSRPSPAPASCAPTTSSPIRGTGSLRRTHGMPPGHLPVRSYLAVPVITADGSRRGRPAPGP